MTRFRHEHWSRKAFLIGNGLFMALVLFIMLVPLLKVLSDSFDAKGSYELRFFPRVPTLNAYKIIVTSRELFRPFLISIYVTVVGTAIALAITSMAAYAITQKEMPGRSAIVYLMLFTMIFEGGLIPFYLVVKNLGLLNRLWSVILPNCVNTFYLILMKNFFLVIPKSLPESAEIDGCSPFKIYLKIVLPMSRPALAAIGLFYIVAYWNEFFYFAIFIVKPELYNFQVKLREIVLTDEYLASPNIQVYPQSLQNAAIVVAIIPVMLIYPFLQKHFVTGITLGAVKE